MRFIVLLCVLAATLARAQTSSSASSSAPPAKVPEVVTLASQKVDIPVAQIPLTTLEGKEVHLGDFGAKVVVVSMWSTIFPEHTQLEHLEALRQAYRGNKDVAFLAVNVDRPKSPEDIALLRDVAKEVGAGYPMLVDKDLKLMAFVNGKLRPSGMEGNSFLIPSFLLFTHGFKDMEQPERSEATRKEDVVKQLRGEVEKRRSRK